MRHRKKWIAAFLTLAASLAAYHFWPRDNPEARRLLGELRSLIEKELQNDPPPPTATQVDADAHIEVELLVAKINMTDATCGLFANSTKTCSAPRFMRVASPKRFAGQLEELRSAQMAKVLSMPRIAMNGQPANIVIGSEVPIPLPGAGKGVAYRNVGVTVAFAAKPLPNGHVQLDLDCEFSRITRTQLDSRNAATTVILGDQETILIGGLAQKGTTAVIFNVPLLSDLAWIGPWFRYSWQRPIDEELIVLATPRIVYPQDRRRTIPVPAAASRSMPAGLVR